MTWLTDFKGTEAKWKKSVFFPPNLWFESRDYRQDSSSSICGSRGLLPLPAATELEQGSSVATGSPCRELCSSPDQGTRLPGYQHYLGSRTRRSQASFCWFEYKPATFRFKADSLSYHKSATPSPSSNTAPMYDSECTFSEFWADTTIAHGGRRLGWKEAKQRTGRVQTHNYK